MSRTAGEWREYLAEIGCDSSLCREIIEDFEELERQSEGLIEEVALLLRVVCITLARGQ